MEIKKLHGCPLPSKDCAQRKRTAQKLPAYISKVYYTFFPLSIAREEFSVSFAKNSAAEIVAYDKDFRFFTL